MQGERSMGKKPQSQPQPEQQEAYVGLLRVRIRGRDSEYGAPSLRIRERERERELALRVNNELHGAYEMSLLRAPRVPSPESRVRADADPHSVWHVRSINPNTNYAACRPASASTTYLLRCSKLPSQAEPSTHTQSRTIVSELSFSRL